MAVTRSVVPIPLRRRLAWTAALVLIALGGAGLTTAADRPATDELRPELSAHTDRLAGPWLDTLTVRARELAGHVDELSQSGRDVLSQLATLDSPAMSATLDDGDVERANLALAAGSLADLRGAAPSGLDERRLSKVNRIRLGAIDDIAAGARPVPGTWTTLADLVRGASDGGVISRRVAELVVDLEASRGRVADALADLQ